VFSSGGSDVWSKALGSDFSTRAVVLLNRATNASALIACSWTNLDLPPGPATVRDLWAHADLGTFTNGFTATIPAYGSMLLKITGTPPAPPAAGTNYLGDRQPVYAYTGYGTIVPDKSIGGNPITLNGVAYPRGIGVNSRAGVEHDLAGVCSRFQATVGVDDEVGAKGTVIFQVFADGMQIYNSGVMTGGMAARAVDLDVTGVRRLVLGVGDADDGNSYDHGDWANALVIVTNTTPQVPHAPTGLAAGPGNPISLAWTATVGADGYNVKRAAVSGGPYAVIGSPLVAAFADTNVVSGNTYYYVVSAVSGIGESSNSVEVVGESCNVPAAPANVTTSVSNLTVGVIWNASAGATSYAVSRFTSNTPPVLVVSGLTATNFTDTNIAGGMIYFYQVAAANACNQSTPAAFVAANTTAIVTSPSPVWNGASLTTSNWSDIANWDGVSLTAGDALAFAGSLQTDNFNDTAAGTFYASLTFNPGADAFVLGGNPVLLRGGIVNNSAVSQVVGLDLTFSNSVTLNGAGNTLYLAAGLTNTFGTPGSTTLTLAGTGIMDNLLGSLNNPGGTNIVATGGSASWTLLDNAASRPMTAPWVFSINSGQFYFGSTTSFPNLTTTTPNNSPTDNQAGTVTGTAGVFNMAGGVLTTTARFNTATVLNSTGIVNQTGGTLNIGSQFQGANGGNAGEMSLVNLTGGTLNIAGGGGPFYVASRGGGTLTISHGATLNCGTLDVSRNANGNTIGSVGVVNLDGGVILASKVATATANAQAGLNGASATFNFNGGTLRMSTNVPSFFQGSTVAPAIPIYTVVKSGGAVIDSNGRTNTFAEALVHDAALGPLPDGGLTKNGSGSLILVSNLTYTGGTTINAGALVLSNSVALNTSPLLTVAAGALLDAGGRSDGMLSLVSGQMLTGSGVLTGNVTVGPGATVAPGNAITTLAFNNNLTLGGGTTLLKVNRSASPSNDVLQVAGGLIYGGTLVITNVGPAPLLAGDSFKLFNAAAYAGAFTNLQPAIPALNLAWNTNTLTNGILGVIARPTPPPVFASVRPQGMNLVFAGTNGVSGWQFFLLTSTNLAAPLAGWNRAATNGFLADGSFNFTNPAAPGWGACYYLLLLAP
jgi:autotransporter-associated beta strand protein